MQKTILITGGAGFIGSHVLRLFIKKYPDYKIVNADKLTYAGNLENLKDVEGKANYFFEKIDIVDKEEVKKLFERYNFDGVIHLAAESHVDRSITNPMEFIMTNIIGTVNLLRASVKYNVQKFHHISTDEVYGSLEYDDTDLFKEDTPYDPRNPYSASKAASDYFVKSWHNTYGLPYLITNCSNNYGPHQHVEKLIPLVVSNALDNKITYMHGGGNQIRDWLYVYDHCAAIWELEVQGIINDHFNIGGSCEKRNIDVTKTILDMMNKPYDLIGINEGRPGIDKRYGMDHSKITNRTGWRPFTNFDIGLRATVSHYIDLLT